MRFQREEVGFHVCHLPETFKRIILVLYDTKILWSKSLSINRGTNSGEMAKFDKSYWILKTSTNHGCLFKMAAVNLQEELM